MRRECWWVVMGLVFGMLLVPNASADDTLVGVGVSMNGDEVACYSIPEDSCDYGGEGDGPVKDAMDLRVVATAAGTSVCVSSASVLCSTSWEAPIRIDGDRDARLP